MPTALDPTASPRLWELTDEIVLIVVLFATGLRIDTVGNHRLSPSASSASPCRCPSRLSPCSLARITVAGAVLLGAARAPTDPVLAGQVQVSPPLEGGEHPVRFALTAEAGLKA